MNCEGIHPDSEREDLHPRTPCEVSERFFPLDKPKCGNDNIEWVEFTVRDREHFFRVVDDADSDASFVVETEDGAYTVYACRRDRANIKIKTNNNEDFLVQQNHLPRTGGAHFRLPSG